MKRLIFATGNQDKLREIRAIMEGLDYEILSMKEAGIDIEVEENGTTFRENALIKARAINQLCHELVLADDSGLEVDYMDKQPGVFSHRFGGADTPYSIKNQMIIDNLAGVPEEKRTARFVCAIAAVFPDGRELVKEAAMEGRIGYQEAGGNGFGYDPIFYLPEFGCTSAELSPEDKNAISHRGKALRMMRKELESM
ncbi:MAG: RdgB/HAM1 family non-canonical purine NTP pyrophosphatase [Bacteroides sp.]|nr:RdgB/HAM1 family non-canonical purine NTP pyrophosphatase [Bacteroides sp.]MCM1550332.1 RdgB/HAM1 family non-canonical purine NTP pyrophosphatase [Clostridium sp.]